MFGLEFSPAALINGVLGGLIGAWITLLFARRFQKKLHQATNTLGRMVVAAARNPHAVDIRFDEDGWPTGVTHTMDAEPASFTVSGADAALIREDQDPQTT